ncbi:MAG: XTP/dITP diphosphatase [Thermodesulfobacteriota bacterium]
MILVLATHNEGKKKEIETSLNLPFLEIKSLADFPAGLEIIEDGDSFAENALKKARTVCEYLKMPVLADDSGLMVDVLGGAPGIFSARFSGPRATDQANNEKLLTLLEGVPEDRRTSRFICALVFYAPSGQWRLTEGICQGRIALAPEGDQGFGYDPVFYLPEWGKTMAQLPLEAKNRISHRARALEKMRPHLFSLVKDTTRG